MLAGPSWCGPHTQLSTGTHSVDIASLGFQSGLLLLTRLTNLGAPVQTAGKSQPWGPLESNLSSHVKVSALPCKYTVGQ